MPPTDTVGFEEQERSGKLEGRADNIPGMDLEKYRGWCWSPGHADEGVCEEQPWKNIWSKQGNVDDSSFGQVE